MTGKIRVLDYSLENPASLRVRERKREREREIMLLHAELFSVQIYNKHSISGCVLTSMFLRHVWSLKVLKRIGFLSKIIVF